MEEQLSQDGYEEAAQSGSALTNWKVHHLIIEFAEEAMGRNSKSTEWSWNSSANRRGPPTRQAHSEQPQKQRPSSSHRKQPWQDYEIEHSGTDSAADEELWPPEGRQEAGGRSVNARLRKLEEFIVAQEQARPERQSSPRPEKKTPIKFKDADGRKFSFLWYIAYTWKVSLF